uniref:Uncharacterized protein n=1 Tax=Arundo donax TaxID=35708 RepID=A0A0A8ZLE3_ARUDO
MGEEPPPRYFLRDDRMIPTEKTSRTLAHARPAQSTVA